MNNKRKFDSKMYLLYDSGYPNRFKAKYAVKIEARGRGPRVSGVTATSLANLKKQANEWLEYGTVVYVQTPSGKRAKINVT